MPVWFEVIVLMLVGYFAGIGIGWGLWGRAAVTGSKQDLEQKDRP